MPIASQPDGTYETGDIVLFTTEQWDERLPVAVYRAVAPFSIYAMRLTWLDDPTARLPARIERHKRHEPLWRKPGETMLDHIERIHRDHDSPRAIWEYRRVVRRKPFPVWLIEDADVLEVVPHKEIRVTRTRTTPYAYATAPAIVESEVVYVAEVAHGQESPADRRRVEALCRELGQDPAELYWADLVRGDTVTFTFEPFDPDAEEERDEE